MEWIEENSQQNPGWFVTLPYKKCVMTFTSQNRGRSRGLGLGSTRNVGLLSVQIFSLSYSFSKINYAKYYGYMTYLGNPVSTTSIFCLMLRF